MIRTDAGLTVSSHPNHIITKLSRERFRHNNHPSTRTESSQIRNQSNQGQTLAKYAQEWPAWGHRKIRAIAAADGVDIGSVSSVKRAMARRPLLLPVRYQAQRRQLARARRAAFVEPVRRRNRVWQADFSEFETRTQGTWRLGGVVDYWAKIALCCPITATQTARDLIATFDAAVTAAEALIAMPLLQDCLDADTGELTPVVIVTDNGPAMKSLAVARWFAARPELTHVRTRHR